MAMTEQARLAQKAKRAANAKPPVVVDKRATLQMKVASEIYPSARMEFLVVAAGAVGLCHAELARKANGVTWQAAVDAILAVADKRWPR